MHTLIHVTHEAHRKMGGIGAVLEGMLTARAYQAVARRTILIGCREYFVPALERRFGKTRRAGRFEKEAAGASHPAAKASPEPATRKP